MGETEQAVEAFEKYHDALPSDYQTILELAYLYAQVQKEDRALTFFAMAAKSPDATQAAQARRGYQSVEAPIAAEIDRRGMARSLGWHHMVTPGDLASALSSLSKDAANRQKMSENGRRFIDGQGARRVVEAMAEANR